MTYNELAQVLETKNPDTGKLYTLSDLNVFKMQDVGTGMLEDNIFSTGQVAQGPGTTRRRREVPEGDVPGLDLLPRPQAACVNIMLQNGPTLPKGHQTWQMNEINKLVWPATRRASAS